MLEVDIVKRFRDFTLSVHFSAKEERLGILGASGCGKSMTLRCIAGITKPDEGFIRINDRVVFDSKRRINLPPQERRTGYLFQHYALFPTMTLRQNWEIVLRHLPNEKRKHLVDGMLEKLHLQGLEDSQPTKLSGGQKQRAAMGRMLLSAPEMMMLDEPFSALDSFLKASVETELMPILYDFQNESKTVLFVSHNRDEIYRICQRMIVLDKGSITAQGTTGELFHQPQTVSAARLTGVKNIVPIQKTGSYQVRIPEWNIKLTTSRGVLETHTHIGIRAHHIREALPEDTVNCFECLVERQQSEPFRINEHLFILPDGIATESVEEFFHHKKPENAPLIRYISGSIAPQFAGERCKEWKRFHIPPQDIILLKD